MSKAFTPPYIMSLDQGTSSSRAIIFDSNAKMVTFSQKEFTQITPEPGWCEHDPMEVIDSMRACMKGALANAEMVFDLSPDDIKAIGITNHRESICVWDRDTGKPLYNIIVWLDTRTKDIVHRLTEENDGNVDALRPKCGLPFSTYFSAMKLLWLMENVDQVKTAVDNGSAMFGTIDTWLIWNLTGGARSNGVHVTDVTNASRTMLMNLESLQWDQDICDQLGIPISILPEIKSSSEVYGTIPWSKDGILMNVPIAGCLGDQQAALFGQTCFSPGEAKNTYGTGCFMLLNTGETPIQSNNGLLTTVGYQIGDAKPVYALEGSIAIAGAAVQFLRDNLGMIKSASEINELAQKVDDTGDVYFVPAFSGLFAPHWCDDARGIIVGISQFTNKNHIARATLEAVCWRTKEVLNAMEIDSGVPLQKLRVDGGMSNSKLTMQLQSEILNVPVVRPSITESTALGAAFAAGLAVGVWKDLEEVDAVLGDVVTTFECKEWTDEDRESKFKRWQLAVEKAKGWLE